jgi:ribosomal-protein-alanine N-acetyltransferase
MNLHKRFPNTFIVAEENGELIGYIMCRIETGIPSFKLLGLTKKGHVISLAVLPKYQRSGVGYSLMLKAVEAMEKYDAKEAYLEVRINNEAAVNLYKKMGFEIVKKNIGYYADGESAYRMAKKILVE